MKHNILTSISGACLLSALVLAGCTKAIPAPSGYPEDGVVRISTGAPVTKAEGNAGAYSGSSLGLYVNYGNGDAYTKHNIQWTKDAASGEWTPAEQMLWKNPTATPTLWAYAPYSDSQLKPSNTAEFGKLIFEIPADQSAGTDAADLVTWGQKDYVLNHNTNQNFSADGKVQINFSHALVKLTFDFTIRTQFAPGTTISKVTLHGTKSKVDCDIFNSSVAATSDAISQDIVFHKVDGTHYEGIFFPGDGQKAGNTMLTVEMSDGTVLTYSSKSDLTLESGKAYTMKMYLGRLAVELGQVTLDPWQNYGTEIEGGSGSETAVPVWDGRNIAAEFESGTGTQSDPFIIKNGEQLAYLAQQVNAQQVNAGTNYVVKYFKLGNSINLGGHEWTPIGTNKNIYFKDHFDGNGYSIYGLKVNSTSDYAGLFGYAGNNSVISNLSLINPDVTTSEDYSGAVCGFLSNASILNCTVSGGRVSAGVYRSGGICGQTYGTCTISKCSVIGSEINAKSLTGGLCGDLEGTLESCSVKNATIISEGWAGGLAASCQSSTQTTLKNCSIKHSKIEFKGTQDWPRVGGLVGYCKSQNMVVSDCSGQVDCYIFDNNSEPNIGGLFGEIYYPGIFTNCHFDGRFMNENGDIIDFVNDKYTNVTNINLTLGAAIGKHYQDRGNCTFIGCSYNADKTGNIPAVKSPLAGQSYDGITAKNLGN